jgi:hypothetical protein
MSPIRPIDYRILAKVFEQDGFAFNRQRGDHLIYKFSLASLGNFGGRVPRRTAVPTGM